MISKWLACLVSAAWLTACGGGSDSPPASPPPPPPPPAAVEPLLSVADLTLTEGVASLGQTFVVSLDRASAAQVTVRYTTTPGTALTPEDFSHTEGVLTFAPGTLVANVRVAIADDSLYEGIEAFAFVLSDPTTARIGRAAAVGRIVDDESPPTLSVQAASLAEASASGAQLEFELMFSAASAVRGSVNYTTAAITASEGADYAATQGEAVFLPGTTSVTVSIPVIDDSLDEFDEELSLELSSPSEIVLTNSSAVGVIVDDDPLPILSIGDAGLSESGGMLSFVVRLSSPSGKPVAVQYASSNVSAAGGTDYAHVAGTLDFLPGEVEKSIGVPLIGDALYEGQETFLVTLSSPSHAALGQAVAVGTILDDDPLPPDPPAGVTVTDLEVTEGDSGVAPAGFSVQLSEAESAAASVDWTTIAGTATDGDDFVGAGGTLVFSPGTTMLPIDVGIIGDTIDEDDETLRIVLSDATGNIVLVDGTADARIVDDDPLPALSITDAGMLEGNAGNATLSLTVSLSPPSGRTVAVSYATSSGSAAAGLDFGAVSGILSFGPGVSTQLISVPVVADLLHEADETFEVTLSDPEFAVIDDGLATATISNDDDAPALSVGDASVAEGDSGTALLAFPLSLGSPSGLPVSVDFTTSDLTATAGEDYVATSGTAVFSPGQTAAVVEVAVIGDALIETDEALALDLSGAVNASLADAAVEGTILDDDGQPLISVGDVSVTEGSSGTTSMSFTVQLSDPSPLPVSVDFATANGTATAVLDYLAASGTLVIAAGATGVVVDVSIIGDVVDELDETFSLTLSNPVNAGIVDGLAQGTVLDDDAAPVLGISNAVLDEGGAGGAALEFTVSLSAISSLKVTVDFASIDGSAAAGADYIAAAGALTFAPGETSKLIAVAVLDDAIDEEDEQLQLVLANAQNASIAVGVGTGTITDDDAAPSIGIGNADIAEGDAGAVSLNFTLTLSGSSGWPVAVDFVTSNGSASAGQDYTAAGGTVNFATGETSKAVSVEILGDSLHEADETFTVGLSNAVNAVLALTQAQGTIVNDDGAPLLSVADVTQIEGSAGPSTMSFTVQLSAASALDADVSYSTSDGTAQAGDDYLPASGTLTIPAGGTSGVVEVTINGDTTDEANESYSLTLSNPVNAGLADGVAQGNITDDDAAPTLTINNDGVSEGGAGLSFPIALSAASGREVRVDFASTSGTALSGADFGAVGGTLIFTPGETSKLVAVAVVDDTLDEDDESMTVTLSNALNASIALGMGTGTITDNDAQPSLTISDATVSEGDSGTVALSFAVALSAASGKQIDVTYLTEDGTAEAGDDYQAESGSLSFNPGVTSLAIAIDVVGDTLEEGDETLLVNLSNGVNVSIADAAAIGTITDDDGAVSWGLDSRPSNQSCIAPDRPVVDATIALGIPFPNLPPVQQPLALSQPPGDDSKWFVIEQPGRVRAFDNSPVASTYTTVIDIRTEVDDSDQEMGLLGMAFHPEYSTTGSPHAGELFLAYTASGPISRVSRFKTTDNWATWTQELVIEADREFTNHNGGNIAFGPDGYLYVGWGDGGGDSDPFNSAQDTTNLLGTILRLDVNGATPYEIPPDNPFAENPTCPADHSSLTPCPEIYAWGFRNPWRWSFDSATGDLWVGDVGENSWEEINLVERGGNYGWDVREGTDCFEPSVGCNATGLIDPIAEYDHGFGRAVVGGFVYRGSSVPELFGRYLFADTYSGRVWMLETDGQGGYSPVELLHSSALIGSFAQGNDGELYLLDIGAGNILRIVAGSGGGTADTIPTLLSETGCFDPVDPRIPAGGLIPYSINAPFWSDGADKDRYLAIPDGTTITVEADDDWTFPPGSVIVKNFNLGGELFETRLLMRHPDGVWAGYTYEWNEDGTDAARVIGGKTKLIDGQPWIYPSEGQCDNCHTLAAGFTLGLESAQLNRPFLYPSTGRTANQLVTLDHIALFGAPLPNVPLAQPRLADPTDTAESLNDRARAYLHTNCAQCHRPLGPAPSSMDLRYQTLLSATNTCDVVPAHGNLGVANARLIAPGAPANSIVINRMSRRDINGMPPLASNFVDFQGAASLASWIGTLSSCN